MIDAERMLGSLVRNAMGGSKKSRKRRRKRKKGRKGMLRGASSMLGPGAKSGLALGALGVAFGVYEHLTKQQQGGGAAPAPGAASPSLPPLPGAAASAPQAPLPPLPGQSPEPPKSSSQAEATLLVKAMIAAANADHEVDDDERDRIVRSLEESGLGDEEKDFVLSQLESPIGLDELAAGAKTPDLAGQVYLASLMAIEVDTRAEEKYLERLAAKLGLDEERVAELEDLLGAGE